MLLFCIGVIFVFLVNQYLSWFQNGETKKKKIQNSGFDYNLTTIIKFKQTKYFEYQKITTVQEIFTNPAKLFYQNNLYPEIN